MTLQEKLQKYPPVLSVKDLEEILRISHNTAYALVRSGQIHSVRAGRSYRIPINAVVDYLKRTEFVADRPHLWYNIGVPAMRQRKE